ncbi:tail fiber protein [Yersinia wautersii]|uniref:Tail fiber repeat 2-containing protein n=1 Tax=Yersinia wautersii TaxID=1341643 RepID=A0ABP1ZB00_9GAMM|nr:phage tail protein [Yersinia wautersii]CRG48970.1 tail fiber repeat 2-containing protein [Yersinia wautersii]
MKNIMPPINTPDNAFHDGNPATGEQGTIVPGLWLNNVQSGVISIQQELLSVLTKAGIEIDETKQDQLVIAITKLITQGIPELPSASLSQKGIVQLSSATNSDSETLAATSKAVKTANDAALKIVNNLSEIAVAGPSAVLAAITNLNLLTTVNNANGALQVTRSLSDLNDTAAARTNLGLGGASSLNIGTTAGTVAAGNDSRIVNAISKLDKAISIPGNLNAAGIVTATKLTSNDGVRAAGLDAFGDLEGVRWATTGSFGTLSDYLADKLKVPRFGEIGSYCLVKYTLANHAAAEPGTLVAGAYLFPTATSGNAWTASLSGTWQVMGAFAAAAAAIPEQTSLVMRVS